MYDVNRERVARVRPRRGTESEPEVGAATVLRQATGGETTPAQNHKSEQEFRSVRLCVWKHFGREFSPTHTMYIISVVLGVCTHPHLLFLLIKNLLPFLKNFGRQRSEAGLQVKWNI